jgi:acetyl esterase/lipase
VVYAQGAVGASGTPGTIDLGLDVYRPDNPDNVVGSALVLVHGGGFTSGDRASPDMVDAAQTFAALGWVCFSIDYRLLGDDPPAPLWLGTNAFLRAVHAAMVDTKRAVRWARAHASAYGIDPRRVAGLGHSAGAYCVIQACISDEDDFANDTGTPVPDQWPAQRGRLNAGVEVSGGVELNTWEFSAGDSPLMIWHGTADGTVPFSEAAEIRSHCVANAIPHRLFALDGKQHGEQTWLALYDGRGLKSHAREFLDLFFAARIDARRAGGTVTLAWPSVSNALYDVRGTPALADGFTNLLYAGVTATGELCEVEVEAPLPGAAVFYRLGVKSGQ